ncbi:MAG TPA: hypothetical protein VF784_08520 [Anaerolineales bacterium]
MSNLADVLPILAGFAVRLAVPVLMTVIIVRFLRGLDERWQSDARNAPAPSEKPACWEIMECAPAEQEDCPGYTSPLPCWQARRMDNGYLREECLACKVFLKAPVPGFA